MNKFLRSSLVYVGMAAFIFLIFNFSFVPQVEAAPSLNWFYFSPATITTSPQWVTVSWKVSGATNCDMYSSDASSSAWGAHTANVGVQQTGSVLVKQATYTLVCTDGITWPPANYPATVTYSPPVPPPTISFFTSSAASVPSTGGSVTFNWSSNAASCSTSWAGGNFPASGSSGPHWITSTANYTLTCTNSSGSVSRTVTVSVLAPSPPTLNFYSDVSTVTAGGSTGVHWRSTNTSSCSSPQINTFGLVNGDVTVYPTGSGSTYTINCVGTDSSNISRSVTISVLAPSAPTGLTLTPNPTNENRATISWNAVTGAAYYSVRVDNNSDSWKYTNDSSSPYYTAGMTDSCLNDIVDGDILANGVFAGPTNYTPGVDSCGNINRTSVEVELVASSDNHIWVHSRGSDHSWSPMAQISVALAPPSPSGLTATCDATGNTTVSWNAVPVPGGFDPAVRRHYSFRLDNQRNSSQFEASSYPANNVACVNDDVNNNSVLARSSGVGTDYCGNMRNTSWTGVINPSGTQRVWVHTKSWDFLTFGNRPPSEIEFTCPSGESITYVCTGTVPLNATMYLNDNVGLTANTPYTYWPTDTGTRCQYSCNTGSTWDGSSCVVIGGGSVAGVCGPADGVRVSTAPTSGLCSAGIATAVTGSSADGGWNWFCNGTGGGSNSGLCSAPYLPTGPATIMICQDSCTNGFRRDGSTFSIPLAGPTVNLLACIGYGTCVSPSNQLLSVASNPATWNDRGTPDNSVSLSSSTSATVSVTPIATGLEVIDLTAAGYGTVSTSADVTCVPSGNCAADSRTTQLCSSQTFTIDNGCSGTTTCFGTRSCDYNWKEVAP